MAKFLILLAIIACSVSFSTARVARDVPQPPTLTEMFDTAETAVRTLHTKFLEFFGVESNTQLVDVVQEKGKTYAQKLEETVNEIAEEGKKSAGKVDELVIEFNNGITAVVEDFKTKSPELYETTQKYEEDFQKNLQKVLDDTEVLRNDLKKNGEEISSSLEVALKKIYDTTLETAQQLTVDVEQALKKDPKK